jgi:CRISPR-associated protein Cmr6
MVPSNYSRNDRGQPQSRLPIPKKSWQAFNNLATNSIANPGLLFERYLGFSNQWEMKSESKKSNLDRIKRYSLQIDKELLKANHLRWKAMIEDQEGITFQMKTEWRFVTGIGRKGSLEVGFLFNRYGFPVLPGSSVKGITRALALIAIAKRLEINQLNSIDAILNEPDAEKFGKKWEQYSSNKTITQAADVFRSIFGTQGQAGIVYFFDAIPDSTTLPSIVIDIMNPHFPKYYQEQYPPTDNQDPIPVQFLTVENTSFWFGLACQKRRNKYHQICLEMAKGWLLSGLEELGVGAKTNAGYGYFESIKKD